MNYPGTNGNRKGHGRYLHLHLESLWQTPQAPARIGDQCDGAGDKGEEASEYNQEQQDKERFHG